LFCNFLSSALRTIDIFPSQIMMKMFRWVARGGRNLINQQFSKLICGEGRKVLWSLISLIEKEKEKFPCRSVMRTPANKPKYVWRKELNIEKIRNTRRLKLTQEIFQRKTQSRCARRKLAEKRDQATANEFDDDPNVFISCGMIYHLTKSLNFSLKQRLCEDCVMEMRYIFVMVFQFRSSSNIFKLWCSRKEEDFYLIFSEDEWFTFSAIS
jgi:hypothetical protein